MGPYSQMRPLELALALKQKRKGAWCDRLARGEIGVWTVSLIAPLVIALAVPRWWVVGLGVVLPVFGYWVEEGLGGQSRDGYENWGLVVLPVVVVGCAGLTALIVAVRLWVQRRGGDDLTA